VPPRSMEGLRIGIVAPMIVKSATGLSNYIAELVPQLCDAGHRVTVAATDCAYRGAPADEIVPVDPRSTLMVFPSTGRVQRRIYHSPQLAAWLRQNVHRFDVVDIQGLWFWSTVEAARACMATNVPFVMTLHGMMGRWDWAKRPLAKRIFFRTMLADCWRSASAVRFMSEGELRSSMVAPAAPSIIIPPAITLPVAIDQDTARRAKATLKIAEPSPLVLFVGRVTPQKGVLELVQAFDLVRQRCPDAVLAVAGALEGEYGQAVRELASKLTSHSHIRVLGRVSTEAKKHLLAAASVFVTLSRNEGLSTAMLEALGQGIPAVCTADSNLPEVAEYSAGVITRLDPNTAAGAIISILEDDQRRRTMGANARRMVADRFTWSAVLPRLEALYEGVVQRARLRADPTLHRDPQL